MNDKQKCKYSFRVNKEYASISFENDNDEKRDMFYGKWSHYPILHKVLNFMQSRGFEVGRDPRIQEQFKCLNKHHWYGRKGDLEFKAERYPRGFKLEFFQNINYKNKNGGCYDFDKFQKMPYIIKLMFINETNKITNFLEGLGILNETQPEYKLAEDIVKQQYVESWHHPQEDMNFRLSDLDGLTADQSYNNTDRDKKTIFNGQIKYFRERDGRLRRGKVYHNINNMWWVILDKNKYTNVASFQLFDATEAEFKARRVVKDERPRFKYAVITSQYGYSYHSFICKFDVKTFLENAKNMARELIAYVADDGRKIDDDSLGDLTYWKKKTIKAYYNVNAAGDIYFRNCDTLEEAKDIVQKWDKQAKSVKGTFRRKGMAEAIRKHHNVNKIKAIIEKYFEIVQEVENEQIN